MKLVTYRPGRGPARLGALAGDVVLDLGALAAELARGRGAPRRSAFPKTMLDLVHRGPDVMTEAGDAFEDGRRRLEQGGADSLLAARLATPASKAHLEAPIPRPARNIVCLGRNYAEHAAERGADVPEHPVFFTKVPESVVAPGADVVYHAVTQQLDYEVELAVVIGRQGTGIARDEALSYVFGYTIVNDVTARDLQKRHGQWFKGKTLDTFCPMGPVLVTADEIPDPQALAITLRVNGETRQSSHTSKMIFPVAQCVAVLSEGFTMFPGDVIATGTPDGVGAATGRFLKPGDDVEAEVEKIGVLKNRIVAP
jgi:2-keto-4-pentenoate hydratase/2-oxohepta-3-ene-1,7-dioic acid hydratase in catechol pathway